MFSTDERCLLNNNQLAEVICQLRFPDILAIGANDPVAFQEAIRDIYPQFAVHRETPPPKITGVPGNLSIQSQPAAINYQFTSADGIWRINLGNNFISLACTQYTCWEYFAKQLDKPLVALIQIYKPAYFQRIGLRYLNFISRKCLSLEGVPYSQLIRPQYLGPLADEHLLEQTVSRCNVDAEFAVRGSCRVKIHAGPGMIKKKGHTDSEARFIFDQDLYISGNVPINVSASALETLHSQAYPIFRGAITDTLFNAMDPEPI